MHPTRIFKTPEELEQAFEQYKESLKEEAKQWLKIQYVGKDGERVADPQKVPYTLEGFKRYCRKIVPLGNPLANVSEVIGKPLVNVLEVAREYYTYIRPQSLHLICINENKTIQNFSK
jgi:hypothetical protein